MEKQHYIYITTNLVNNKKYIGKHYGYLDDNYLGSGIALNNAIQTYGKKNFKKEIYCICESNEEACKKEQEIIEKFKAVESDDYYNLSYGGDGGWEICSKNKKKSVMCLETEKIYPSAKEASIDTGFCISHI